MEQIEPDTGGIRFPATTLSYQQCCANILMFFFLPPALRNAAAWIASCCGSSMKDRAAGGRLYQCKGTPCLLKWIHFRKVIHMDVMP